MGTRARRIQNIMRACRDAAAAIAAVVRARHSLLGRSTWPVIRPPADLQPGECQPIQEQPNRVCES
jgi:hypothetical protein